MNRLIALPLLLALARPALAQEDPFADPADPFADPADPFAQPDQPDQPPAPAFDPDAVRIAEPAPGFELHGRANITLASVKHFEPIEQLRDDSVELSSVDLYAQWFPLNWLGGMAEVELTSELEDGERELEVEPELLLIELRPLRAEHLRLRLGHAPVPFGLERRYYAPSRNELANRPAVYRVVFPGTYADSGAGVWGWWDYGLWGGRLELEAALTKGLSGPDREDRPEAWERDDNHEPQLTGRVAWTVVDLDPNAKDARGLASDLPCALRLTLGASLLFGHYDEQARRRVLLHGFDAELVAGGLRLRAEYVARWFEVRRGPDLNGEGFYVLAAYHHSIGEPLLEELFVAARYGRVDPDRGAREETDLERYHLGVGWVPYPGFTVKLGFEYTEARGTRPKTVFLEAGYAF